MSGADTRTRILDTAERLFGENGFAATSVRALTSEAGVNLAAVHYHFGSRDTLIHAVLARRVEPINRERLERLDAVEERAGGKPLKIETILDIFFTPAFRLFAEPGGTGRSIMQMLSRSMLEANEAIAEVHAGLFSEIFRRFSSAIHASLPHLDRDELAWRFRFMIGSMVHALMFDLRSFRALTGARAGGDPDRAKSRLIGFTAAGFRAPATSTPRGKRKAASSRSRSRTGGERS